MFHIVLNQPEIPPNTGNIIRLAANTGATLHLVKPLGFELTARAVRRAGLDYEELAPVRVHASIAACLEALAGARLFSIETGGETPYSAARFQRGDALLFGAETCGLPAAALALVPAERQLMIPMRPGNRSLNLPMPWHSSSTRRGGRTVSSVESRPRAPSCHDQRRSHRGVVPEAACRSSGLRTPRAPFAMTCV